MTNNELRTHIKQTLDTCFLHLQRIEFAKSKVSGLIPLSRKAYHSLSDEMISFLDQYIYRFSKLQDTMGNRLFPSLLQLLAEPIEDKAFIDILNRLEKIGIINSTQKWIQLRKIRNDIAHEYPSTLEERIEGINFLFEEIEQLKQILENCKSRFEMLI